MREFLLGLYLEYGEREFGVSTSEFSMNYAWAVDEGFLRLAERTHYFARHTPYKITPKGLEYLKNA